MEKQIEEMAEIIRNHCAYCPYEDTDISVLDCGTKCKMEALYNAGYQKQEWISVEDRLPTKDEYLTHHKDGLDTLKRITVAYMTDTIEYAIGCYDGYKWLNQLCNRVIKDVIAWKPFELYTPKKTKGE